MTSSTVRFGPGVTREIGMDMGNMKVKKVCVVTDSNLVKLSPVKAVLDSLTKNDVEFAVYDKVRVEPNEKRYFLFSLIHTIFLNEVNFEALF